MTYATTMGPLFVLLVADRPERAMKAARKAPAVFVGSKAASWGTCLFESLQRGSKKDVSWKGIPVKVSDELRGQGRVVLRAAGVGSTITFLQHANHCPVMLCKTAAPPERPMIRLGACVLARSARTGRVLLTRRPAAMRQFPRAVVAPGGAVDPGESLSEAAARELKEEVGLVAKDLSLLCIWESVYPPRLELGPPTRHFLVFFFVGTVDADEVCVSADEVDSTHWVDPETGTSELGGVYPNQEGEGVARGTAYALDVLAGSPRESRLSD